MQNQIIDIDKLNLQEKFLMMEQLWENLSKNIEKDYSFDWHLDILKQRENQTNFISLDEAKKNLRNTLNI